MDAMSSRISENLRQIRKEKKLSLDSMAEQTGVSKSMLGQMKGNPAPTKVTFEDCDWAAYFTALFGGQADRNPAHPKG